MPSQETIDLLESVLSSVNESKIKEIFDINKVKPLIADFSKKLSDTFKRASTVIKKKIKINNKNKVSVKEATTDDDIVVVDNTIDYFITIMDKLYRWFTEYYKSINLDCKVSLSTNSLVFDLSNIIKKTYDETLKEEKSKNSDLYEEMKKDKSKAYAIIYDKLVKEYVNKPFNLEYFQKAIETTYVDIEEDIEVQYKINYTDKPDDGIYIIGFEFIIHFLKNNKNVKHEASYILIEAAKNPIILTEANSPASYKLSIKPLKNVVEKIINGEMRIKDPNIDTTKLDKYIKDNKDDIKNLLEAINKDSIELSPNKIEKWGNKMNTIMLITFPTFIGVFITAIILGIKSNKIMRNLSDLDEAADALRQFEREINKVDVNKIEDESLKKKIVEMKDDIEDCLFRYDNFREARLKAEIKNK